MSLLRHAPAFDPAAAAGLARRLFDFDATASLLPSERDQNFLLTSASGDRRVLKIANATDQRPLIDAQTAAMAHVAAETELCPRVLPAPGGEFITECEGRDGARHMVRLVTWIPGTPLGSVRRHSPGLLESLGRSLGAMDAALDTFDHPAIHRDFHWDVVHALPTIAAHATRIADRALRSAVERISEGAAAITGRLMPELRRSAIHGDANDFNVIVAPGGDVWSRHERVAGFIDFGDMVHSVTAAEPAVAMAYAMLDKRDPLGSAAAIVRGYHASHPLTPVEIASLFGLAQLRLCMSVCLAAWQDEQRPGDVYLAISQQPIARSLERLAAIPARYAEATLRNACGLDPVPASRGVRRWMTTAEPSPVLSQDLSRAVVLDLSVGSALIDGDAGENTEAALTPRIARAMHDAGADTALGRYGEARLLYTSPFFSAADPEAERRTVHLGVDVFVAPGTPVQAPFDGLVEIAAYNASPLDYGALVILRHMTADHDTFFTIYGHLARRSIEMLRPGQLVERGGTFAWVGAPDENGGWTPHLHLQVMIDLLGCGADVPGVCRASERKIWEAFAPDPGALLGIGGAVVPAGTLEASSALAARRQVIGPSLSVGYKQPLKIARGWMQHLFDVTGRQYLDAYNNVPHVGHSHPYVSAAIASQLRVLNTNTRYLYDELNTYAERLAATLPSPLRVCFFVNSGSEANELALRLARAYTGERDLLVLESAYHGNTTTLIDVSPYKFDGPGGEGRRRWVHVLPVPDVYRGEFTRDDPHAGSKYAASVGRTIDRLQGEEGRGISGFIAETCPSVAGQIMLPPGYLARAYRMVRAGGGVCIADEVQTAYGRLGTHFYAFEAHDVVPDIVVLGKPIGNGYPLGAVVTRPEIAAAFDTGMEFFSTFGGSTASCAAGLAVLDVVGAEQLQQHALLVGGRLLEGLGALAERHAIVGDVRGSGLFLGVELVTSRSTLAPATAEASFVANRLCEEGILIGTDGPFHNVLKIRPPMPFALADADRLVETLDRVFEEMVP